MKKIIYGRKNNGFTMIEILLSIVVLIVIMLAASLFFYNISNLGYMFTQKMETQQEIYQTLQILIPEMRTMDISSLGSYPISSASSSSLVFYSDFDGDGLADQIRYFLDGATFKKGFLKPTGNPLSYNPANEIVNEVVHNMVVSTSGIFIYYGADYTGSESALVFPVDILDIRMIKAQLTAKQDGQNSPISYNISITPKNLQ